MGLIGWLYEEKCAACGKRLRGKEKNYIMYTHILTNRHKFFYVCSPECARNLPNLLGGGWRLG